MKDHFCWRRLPLFLFGAFLIALSPASAAGKKDRPTAPAGRHVRLLAVGNSFSGNATRFLGDLVAASAGGNQLTFGHASIGGCPLEKHVRLAEAFEKDKHDPLGRPYAGKSSLREMLQRQKWDYVTIQQASIKSIELESYRPWARKLHDYIKQYAPQAEVLVHQTWAYRDDDRLFQSGKFSAGEMYRGLRDAYATIAKELGCRVIPVGEAFHQVCRDPGWRFDARGPAIDPKAYRHPQLPEQGRTLHAGWRWSGRDGRHVLSNDTHHAGLAGQYLAACVWFEFLYQQSIVGNKFVPRGLSAEDARFLQEVAHRVVGPCALPCRSDK